MAFTLDLVKPGGSGAIRYHLEDGSYVIGRGTSCALQLPELDVSERHALLMLRGHKARMEDLHSANGTYVNGNPIDGIVEIPPDAIVQIGENMMRISRAEGAAETEGPHAEEPRSRADEESPVEEPRTRAPDQPTPRRSTRSWSRFARPGSCHTALMPRTSSARCSTRPCASARWRICSPTKP